MAIRHNKRSGRDRLNHDPLSWLHNHLDVMINALARLYTVPASTFMTVAVIGIALALPAGLYVLVSNLQGIGHDWSSGSTQISLYLQLDASADNIRSIGTQIEGHNEIESIRSLSQDDALREFEQLGGFGNALEALDRNPLPPVIIATPTACRRCRYCRFCPPMPTATCSLNPPNGTGQATPPASC